MSGSYQASNYTFASGDVARGFIMFKGGFTIPSSGTVFYDTDGPVYGNITFGNSSSILQLGSDLHFGTGGGFSGAGTIDGQSNTIFLGSDQTFNQALTLTNSLIIDGLGHTLTLGDGITDGYFAMDNRSTLTLKNINLIVVNSGGADPFQRLNTKAGYVALQNVNVYLQKNTTLFGNSSDKLNMTNINGFVGIYGPYIAYASSTRFDNPQSLTNITIQPSSTLYFGPGTIFDLSSLTMTPAKKIGFIDNSSTLWLDGCALKDIGATNPGINVIKGTVLFDDKVVVQNDSVTNKNIAQGLVFGDGATSDNDVNVRVLGEAYVVLNGGMHYKHS